MYDILRDRIRTQALRKAIRQTVKKGDIVIDAGTGTGILTLFALEAGAKRVWAIEQDRIISTARAILLKNISDTSRFNLLYGDARKIILPEKADVFLTEMYGSMGYEENIMDIAMNMKRSLKPNARMIPQLTGLTFVPVCSSYWKKRQKFWKNVSGYNFSAMEERDGHRWHILPREDKAVLLGDPVTGFNWKTVSVNEIKFPWSEAFTITIKRSGIMNGIAGGFRSVLSAGCVLDSKDCRHWNQKFFPVDSLRVQKNDDIFCTVTFSAQWNPSWRVEHMRNGRILSEQNHSSLLGFLEHGQKRKNNLILSQSRPRHTY